MQKRKHSYLAADQVNDRLVDIDRQVGVLAERVQFEQHRRLIDRADLLVE